jgi:hypothetical protein
MTLTEFLDFHLKRQEADRVLVHRYGRCTYVTSIDMLRDDDKRDLLAAATERGATLTIEGRRDSPYGDRPVLATFQE